MDILISGVGGQGTILASKILAYSAVLEGRNARTGETIGMSQRGGCVVSHVRTGDVFSPYIPLGSADLLLSFELCEGARNVPQIKKGAFAIVNTAQINPVTVALGAAEYNTQKMMDYLSENTKAVFLDANEIALNCGSVKAVNLVLIGVAYGLSCLDVSMENIIKSIEKNVSPRFYALNVNAFKAGINAVQEMKQYADH